MDLQVQARAEVTAEFIYRICTSCKYWIAGIIEHIEMDRQALFINNMHLWLMQAESQVNGRVTTLFILHPDLAKTAQPILHHPGQQFSIMGY